MCTISGRNDATIGTSRVTGAATLGIVSGNYKVNSTCNDCGRSKEVDVGQLEDKKDDKFEISRLSRMVKGSV